MILRNEDLDPQRCRSDFASAMLQDLCWLGLRWTEGPDLGGPFAPYSQSERRSHYFATWQKLRDGGSIYPCTCSRKDLALAATAPNDSDDEPLYPGRCRARTDARQFTEPAGLNWRFRLADGEEVRFTDAHLGDQRFIAGRDFGDFVVWRRDDVPAYQLAVAVDDDAIRITEVVRGTDLLKSTARQLLLYRALGLSPPAFYHCELVRDPAGQRLAKRHGSCSIRRLRENGSSPAQVLLMAADGAIGIGGAVARSPLPHHQDMRVRIRRFRKLSHKGP